jgi:hypothetical protein
VVGCLYAVRPPRRERRTPPPPPGPALCSHGCHLIWYTGVAGWTVVKRMKRGPVNAVTVLPAELLLALQAVAAGRKCTFPRAGAGGWTGATMVRAVSSADGLRGQHRLSGPPLSGHLGESDGPAEVGRLQIANRSR